MTLSVFEAAREAPSTEALICAGARLTFAELAARVSTRLAELAALEIHARSPGAVALIVDGSLAMFEIIYACFALGIAVLPIHPRLTPPERDFLLHGAAIAKLLDPAAMAQSRPAVAPAARLARVPDEHPLLLVPSSGSTGQPKLVELSRRAFLALARADAERMPPRATDRALLCLPLSHVGGLSVVVRSLCARRACVAFFPPSGGLLQATAELAATLESEQISLLSLVPPVLARLLRDAPELGRLASLRAVLVGGQACPAELFEAARASGLPVLTSYGLTEACSQVSTLSYPPPRQVATRFGAASCGFPLPGVEARVRGGVIEVRGPTLFTGYLGEPCALGADGFFRTGDRGELDPDAGLFVFGRESEVIISGGENVDPSEVEHALLACGGLEAACVFGVPDPDFGERVAAALEPGAGTALNEARLLAALDQHLAWFKQPRALCVFSELPRLGSGKLDRARIRAEATARLRAPERARRG